MLSNLQIKYELTKHLDQSLLGIHDSDFGLDKKKITYINDNVCTHQFFESLFKIDYIKKNTEFSKIKTVLEYP